MNIGSLETQGPGGGGTGLEHPRSEPIRTAIEGQGAGGREQRRCQDHPVGKNNVPKGTEEARHLHTNNEARPLISLHTTLFKTNG